MAAKIVYSTPKVCPNRHPRFPPAETSPIQWLRAALPSNWEVISFSGFSVDAANKVTRFLMLLEFTGELSTDLDVRQLIASQLAGSRFRAMCNVANAVGVSIDLYLCPLDYPHVPQVGKPVWLVPGIHRHASSLAPVHLSFADVQCEILKLRGFSFAQPKPLDSARTHLECALVRTGNPWPGDVDGIVVDHNGVVRGTMEFKTHNLNYPIAQQYFMQFPQSDQRRFAVQNHLRAALGGVPFVFIIWGPNHQDVKIQVIDNAMKVITTKMTTKIPATFCADLLSVI